MKRICSFVMGMVFMVNAMAQDSTGLAHPESVNSDGKFLYVTNLGKAAAPTVKDGDGSISKLSLDGKLITQSITGEKLNAPKGTAVIKGVLYVADIDRIVGHAMRGERRKRARKQLARDGFVVTRNNNGQAAGGSG
jgi:DNA-binding beta-propeller fold protein YncE